jgi:hypothetical protein
MARAASRACGGRRMRYARRTPYKLPPRYRTHEEAVQDILADLTAQPRPAWANLDAATLAQGLELAVRQGVRPAIVEAMWRFYEHVNEEEA